MYLHKHYNQCPVYRMFKARFCRAWSNVCFFVLIPSIHQAELILVRFVLQIYLVLIILFKHLFVRYTCSLLLKDLRWPIYSCIYTLFMFTSFLIFSGTFYLKQSVMKLNNRQVLTKREDSEDSQKWKGLMLIFCCYGDFLKEKIHISEKKNNLTIQHFEGFYIKDIITT